MRVTLLITPIKVLTTLLTKSHDPPSSVLLEHGIGPGNMQKLPYGRGP